MTLYAGEEVRISATADDFDQETALTDTDVLSVSVTVYDSASVVVVDDESMTYDSDGFWFYMWDTINLPAGTYKAKVAVVGLDGKSNWEWKRIRLSRDPVTTI